MTTPDSFDLQRFVDAQEAGDTYAGALDELRRGRKQGHWIWFVLPQLRGLGRSSTAQHYGLSGREEAAAYLGHPVLGPRLRESAAALAGLDETDATRVLGAVDAMKLRSSMTLFARVAPEERLFTEVLDRFFGGAPDEATLAVLDER
jgi:uncharacterized protein (DUF1810 family)